MTRPRVLFDILRRRTTDALVALSALLLLLAGPALAQDALVRSKPRAVPIADTIPPPSDVPYPGTLTLDVDATDPLRAILRVTEVIPVAAGRRQITLLYPQWRPGNHSATGRMVQLSELRFRAGSQPLKWRRDPAEPFAFHVELPANAATITVQLTYAGALQSSEGQVLANPAMFDLQWDRVALYPAGHYVRQVRVRPSVTLPAGWQAATALDGEAVVGDTHTFAETDFATLADSPLFAGRNFRRWDLGGEVRLDTFADDAKDLAATPELIEAHRKLVREATALFGGRHFDHYDLLMALSDNFYAIGTEHQRSAEMQASPSSYRLPALNATDLRVVAHEFVHSWNGKFKVPARLWAPDFRQPVQTDLLWVYEGQTQFWGMVLGARSGIQSKDMVLAEIATSAASYAAMPGRRWRSVEDTTAEPLVAYREAKVWPSLTRASDYYREAALVWLEADQILRQRTGGRRGLDDFARAFFGGNDLGQTTYELDDVIAALAALAPYDWRGFFAARIQSPDQPAPLQGIEAAGYRLVFHEVPNPWDKEIADSAGSLSLTHSLGMTLDRAGRVTSVQWDGPAFAAGLVNGAQVVAVNGRAYSHDVMRAAISAAKDRQTIIALLVKRGDAVATVPIAYHGGLRYPWIEPAGAGEQPLDRLLAPRTVG
ncbi:MAG: peptidase M61 [Croceibacterium sp.]